MFSAYRSQMDTPRSLFPGDINLLKVNNGNIKTMIRNRSKLTIKAPVRRWRHSCVFVNSEQISHRFGLSVVDFEKENTSRVEICAEYMTYVLPDY